MNLKNFRKGIITIEIRSRTLEKFLNLLWKNNISIQNIQKENITTMIMKIKLSDFGETEKIAQKTGTKMKIIKREGISFLLIKLKKRIAFSVGIPIFVALLYYLSTYIWNINIVPDKYIAPYEIRQQLGDIGLIPGIRRTKFDFAKIQDQVTNNNDGIMWIRLSLEGSSLKVNYIERKAPPIISEKDISSNIIATRDAVIQRIYTSSGTAVVKSGDIVKKGQLLIKGESGALEKLTSVPAKGDVIGKTFYEESEELSTIEINRTKTGKKITNWFIQLNNKKVYVKKSLNKFGNYDRIVNSILFIKKEVVYEVDEGTVSLDIKKLIQDTSEKLYLKIVDNVERTNKIESKKTESTINGDTVSVRVLVVVEENIGLLQSQGLDQKK